MSEDVRTRIVAAAIHLLETQGPKAFGQVRVAREAGLQQGHLTYYFPKKSDLAMAVIEQLAEKARHEVGRLLARRSELSREELHELFFAQVRQLMNDRKRSRIMLGLAVEAQDDPELAAVLVRQAVFQRSLMAALLERPADDPDVHIALAALRGLGIESLMQRDDPKHVEEVIARFRSWFTRI